MNKIFHSTWFAILLVIGAGVAVANKRIGRQNRANEAATRDRIQSEVSQSISGLKIEMKPLSQAGAAE
jgi:hypothetical protein